MIKAAIFDLDGTLADTLDSIAYCANETLRRQGFAPIEKQEYRYLVGDGAATLIERAMVKSGDTELACFEQAMKDYTEIFEEYCMYRVKPYEGMFDVVAGQKPEIAKKPSPEGVFAILKELQLEKDEVLYLGDTNTDMKTGKSAGVFTIGVLWGFRERAELEENHADAIIAEPAEIFRYL